VKKVEAECCDNHLLIITLVLEAFQEVLSGVKGELVFFISHNIARREVVNNEVAGLHRKGATRVFPSGHHALKGNRYEATGRPSLLPDNSRDGSVVMVAERGAAKSCYSVNQLTMIPSPFAERGSHRLPFNDGTGFPDH